MIFNGIKRRWLRKELAKLQNEQERPSLKWPKSLVVIYDGQQPTDVAPFYEWAQALGIKKEAVLLIAYVHDKKKSTISHSHLVDRKLIKWSGGITDAETKKIIDVFYDLQINYYENQNDLLEYMSLAMRSGLKVAYGNETAQESLYDLAISVPLKDHQAFINELQKYLKILIP